MSNLKPTVGHTLVVWKDGEVNTFTIQLMRAWFGARWYRILDKDQHEIQSTPDIMTMIRLLHLLYRNFDPSTKMCINPSPDLRPDTTTKVELSGLAFKLNCLFWDGDKETLDKMFLLVTEPGTT